MADESTESPYARPCNGPALACPLLGGLLLAAHHYKIINIHFGYVSFLAAVGLVDAVYQLSFQHNLLPLLEVFLRDARQLPPDHDIMPLSVLHFVTFLILVCVGGGNGEGCLFAGAECFHFRVFSKMPDERYAVPQTFHSNTFFVG